MCTKLQWKNTKNLIYTFFNLKKIYSFFLKSFCWCWWTFYVCNMVEIHHKKPLVTTLIFILYFHNTWIRFMMISKIELECFQINLMFGIVYVSKFGMIIIIFKNLTIKSNIYFFQIFYPNFFGKFFFVVYIFSWICNIVFQIFPNKNWEVKKIETKKTCWLGEGGLIQLFQAKIPPN